MKRRCLNPEHDDYADYGGRGIAVAAEWMDFLRFKEWADANGHAPGLEIDRRDVNGPYSPDNCRWVTPQVNAQNRRSTRMNVAMVAEARSLKAKGFTYKSLAAKFGVSKDVLWHACKGRTWKNVPLPA